MSKHKKKKPKQILVCKCFSREEQNLFASTNNSYSPHCYKTTSTIPVGEMKQKTPIKISGKSGTPVYHHFTELLYQIVHELSESLTRRVCTLSAHLWDLNIEIIIAWSLVLCVRRVKVCVFSQTLPLSWQVCHSLFFLVVVWFLVKKYFKEQIRTMCGSNA